MDLFQKLIDRNGYSLGEPWRLNDRSLLVVVPVLKRHPYGERSYLTVEEAKDFLELKDSGNISGIVARNKGDRPIFVRVGTVFEGKGTQSRAAEGSTVLEPDLQEEVTVRCVHASHPIGAGLSFNVASSSSSSSVDYSLLARQGQSAVWASVTHTRGLYSRSALPSYARAIGRPYASEDDLVGTLQSVEKAGKDIQDIVAKIPVDLSGQTGVCVLDLDGVREFEAFDHPDSWTAVSKSIARKYAPELDAPGKFIFELKKESVEETVSEFLRSVQKLAANASPAKSGKSFRVYAFRSDEAVGEYTKIGEDGVHLIAARTQKTTEGAGQGMKLATLGSPPFRPSHDTGYARPFTNTDTASVSEWSTSNFRQRRSHLFLTQSMSNDSTWSQIVNDMSRRTGRKPNPRTLSETLKAGVREGYIVKSDQSGVKRYSLTARGKALAEEQPSGSDSAPRRAA